MVRKCSKHDRKCQYSEEKAVDKSRHRKSGNVTSLSVLHPQLSEGNIHGVLQAKSLTVV